MFSAFLGAYVLVVTIIVLLIINRGGLPRLCQLRRKGSKRGLREGRRYRPDSGTPAQMISYCRSIVQISQVYAITPTRAPVEDPTIPVKYHASLPCLQSTSRLGYFSLYSIDRGACFQIPISRRRARSISRGCH